jgi:hypothetical protein
MDTQRDRQEILIQARTMRKQARTMRKQARTMWKQAQQTRQSAVRPRRKTGMTCTQAQLTALRALMPGATTITCEITAVILARRGLLEDTHHASEYKHGV